MSLARNEWRNRRKEEQAIREADRRGFGGDTEQPRRPHGYGSTGFDALKDGADPGGLELAVAPKVRGHTFDTSDDESNDSKESEESSEEEHHSESSLDITMNDSDEEDDDEMYFSPSDSSHSEEEQDTFAAPETKQEQQESGKQSEQDEFLGSARQPPQSTKKHTLVPLVGSPTSQSPGKQILNSRRKYMLKFTQEELRGEERRTLWLATFTRLLLVIVAVCGVICIRYIPVADAVQNICMAADKSVRTEVEGIINTTVVDTVSRTRAVRIMADLLGNNGTVPRLVAATGPNFPAYIEDRFQHSKNLAQVMGELCDTFGVSFLYFTLPIVRNESKHFLFYGVGGTGGRGGNKTVYQVDQFSPALGDNRATIDGLPGGRQEDGTFSNGELGEWTRRTATLNANGTTNFVDWKRYAANNRSWYKLCNDTKEPRWTAPYIFSSTGKVGITYCMPLYNRNREYDGGMVAMDLSLDVLQRAVEGAKMTLGKAHLPANVLSKINVYVSIDSKLLASTKYGDTPPSVETMESNHQKLVADSTTHWKINGGDGWCARFESGDYDAGEDSVYLNSTGAWAKIQAATNSLVSTTAPAYVFAELPKSYFWYHVDESRNTFQRMVIGISVIGGVIFVVSEAIARRCPGSASVLRFFFSDVAMIFMIFVGLIGTYIILFDGYKAQIGEFNTAVAESTLTQIEERLSSVLTVSTQQFGKVLALLQEACGLMPFITYSTGAAINETSASNEWVWTGSKHVYQRRSANWTVNRTRERDVYELMHIAGTLMGTFNVLSNKSYFAETVPRSSDLNTAIKRAVLWLHEPSSDGNDASTAHDLVYAAWDPRSGSRTDGGTATGNPFSYTTLPLLDAQCGPGTCRRTDWKIGHPPPVVEYEDANGPERRKYFIPGGGDGRARGNAAWNTQELAICPTAAFKRGGVCGFDAPRSMQWRMPQVEPKAEPLVALSLGSYDGGPEEAYEKSTDLVIPLTQRVECTSPPASTWCEKLFRENQNMPPEKKAKGPAGYFGVWDIVSALDKAQDAILASPLPYSENQARYFVVNEKGIMLMSNMPPGTNGINIASMAYNIDVTSQGGRPPPVYISDVKSSEDSFVSRLIEDIAVRYPNRDTDEDKLQAVSKDLEEGALTAKGRGWGRWKNEMRMGFNTDGDTQLDVYTALQKSASKTKYFPMEGDSSNWIVFGVISTDLRDSSPSFNRFETMNLIIAIMIVAIVTYTNRVLVARQELRLAQVHVKLRAIKRSGPGKGVSLPKAAVEQQARALLVRQKSSSSQGLAKATALERTRTQLFGSQGIQLLKHRIDKQKPLKLDRREGQSSTTSTGTGTGKKRSYLLAVAEAQLRRSTEQNRHSERALREAETRVSLEMLLFHVSAAVRELLVLTRGDSFTSGAGYTAPKKNGGSRRFSWLFQLGTGSPSVVNKDRKPEARAAVKARAVRYMFDADRGMTISKMLYYESTGQYWRIVVWRVFTNTLYTSLMYGAVVAHMILSFFEAPAPVMVRNATSTSVIDQEFDGLLIAAGVCNLLHLVDAAVMLCGEGLFAARISASSHLRAHSSKMGTINEREHVQWHIVWWCLVTGLLSIDWVVLATTRYTVQPQGWFNSGKGFGGVTHGSRPMYYILLPITALLRPLLLALRSGSVRESSRSFLHTVKLSTNVFMMLLLIVVICAHFGVLLLSRNFGSDTTYDDWISAWTETFIYMSSFENYGDLVYQATLCTDFTADTENGGFYNSGACPRALNHIFFFTTMLVSMFVVSGLLVAVFQANYAREVRLAAAASRLRRRAGIVAAFALLDADNDGHLTLDEMHGFLDLPVDIEFRGFRNRHGGNEVQLEVFEFVEMCEQLLPILGSHGGQREGCCTVFYVFTDDDMMRCCCRKASTKLRDQGERRARVLRRGRERQECGHPGCNRPPTFGAADAKYASRCSRHRHAGMLVIKKRSWCKSARLAASAYFAGYSHRVLMLYLFLGYLTLHLLYGTAGSRTSGLDLASICFYAVLLLEVFLRIFANGPRHFFMQPNDYYRQIGNRFDFILTSFPIAIMVVVALLPGREELIKNMFEKAAKSEYYTENRTAVGDKGWTKATGETRWSIQNFLWEWISEDYAKDSEGRQMEIPAALDNDPLRLVLAVPLLRIFSTLDSIRELFFGLVMVLPRFRGIVGLLLALILIWSTAGVYMLSTDILFDEPHQQSTFTMVSGLETSGKNAHFNTMLDSFITCWQLFTGSAWNDILAIASETKQTSFPWVPLFFMAFMVVVQLLFSNLLVGVVIDAYSIVSELSETASNDEAKGRHVSGREFTNALAETLVTDRFISITLPDHRNDYVTIRRSGHNKKNAHSKRRAREEFARAVIQMTSDSGRKVYYAGVIQRAWRAREAHRNSRRMSDRSFRNLAGGSDVLRTIAHEAVGFLRRRRCCCCGCCCCCCCCCCS